MIPAPWMLTLVFGSLYGLVFFLIFEHGWLRFFFYWLIGVVGFVLGQWVSGLVGLAVFNIGQVNFFEGTVVSWLSLFAVRAWRH